VKTFLKILGSILLVIVLLAAGVYIWASAATKRMFTETHEAHTVDFPIPFPVSEGNMDSPDLALEQAVERGRHLVTARYACTECHGANLGGGVMVDAFPLGTLLGPNLTLGAGSRTQDYTAKDWDLTVRHGILPGGRASVMPSEDFQRMSDQELSDIVAFIRSKPPVDNTVPASTFGPLGKILVATGKLPAPVSRIESHDTPHPAYPPVAMADSAFGAHLAATCTGCHGANLAGGPIHGGDPKWPPARNLTPHSTGLAAWTFDAFVRAMREGVRPDGTPLKMPMTLIMPYAQKMTPTELEALWVYLNAIPPVDNAIP
jgi:mono/diheme cytochrome c family protein